MYASLLRISGALHLGILEQPEKNQFFSKRQDSAVSFSFFAAPEKMVLIIAFLAI
jgi:hypothetical protein